MAANGARKAPAAPNSSSKPGLVDPKIYEDIFSEKDKKPVTLKIKKPGPRQTIPGNWKESEIINTENTQKSQDPPSPIVNPLDARILASFPTGRPHEDKPDLVQCKHCRRPVLRSVAAAHIKECLNKKQEKLKKKKEAKEAKDAALRREKGEKEDDDGGKINARKSAVKGAIDGEAKKGKKRKLDGEAEKAPNAKKKKKDEPKPKTAKPKGPVDVERQCGVALPNGGFCARSLTCKSHSMGLKRAVPGRSLPYDMLLAQYQKKNQAKQQRAAMDANAPLAEDLEPQGTVDSDEEKEAIMAALHRYRPTPLATFTPISQRSKYQYIRMKDMLRSALGAPSGGGIFSSNPTNQQPTEHMGTARGLALGMMGNAGAGGDGYGAPQSAGAGGFAQPLGVGLDGNASGNPSGQPGSRRQSVMTGQGQRQILPGQLPGPGPQRKASLASVASIGA